jgi:hypothetical protein
MSTVIGHGPIMHLVSLITIVQSVSGMGKSSNFSLEGVMSGDLSSLWIPFFTFQSHAQIAVGAILLYKLKELEQHFGSRKFGSFVFFTYVHTILLHISLGVLGSQMQLSILKSVANGPYFLIAALLTVYYKQIPTLSPSAYSFLGLGISEKTWVYLFGAQLMFNSGLSSFIPSVVGLIAGSFYTSNQMNVQSWRVPSFIEKIVTLPFAILGITGTAPTPIRNSTPATTRSSTNSSNDDDMSPSGTNQSRARMPSWTEATTERLGQFGGLGEAIQPPTEEQIVAVTNMGFPRAKAIHALERTDNNVEQAINFILGGGDE